MLHVLSLSNRLAGGGGDASINTQVSCSFFIALLLHTSWLLNRLAAGDDLSFLCLSNSLAAGDDLFSLRCRTTWLLATTCPLFVVEQLGCWRRLVLSSLSNSLAAGDDLSSLRCRTAWLLVTTCPLFAVEQLGCWRRPWLLAPTCPLLVVEQLGCWRRFGSSQT